MPELQMINIDNLEGEYSALLELTTNGTYLLIGNNRADRGLECSFGYSTITVKSPSQGTFNVGKFIVFDPAFNNFSDDFYGEAGMVGNPCHIDLSPDFTNALLYSYIEVTDDVIYITPTIEASQPS